MGNIILEEYSFGKSVNNGQPPTEMQFFKQKVKKLKSSDVNILID